MDVLLLDELTVLLLDEELALLGVMLLVDELLSLLAVLVDRLDSL